MNRRNFIGNTIAALAGFTILPGAGRLWKAERKVEFAPLRLACEEILVFNYGLNESFASWSTFKIIAGELRVHDRTRKHWRQVIFRPDGMAYFGERIEE